MLKTLIRYDLHFIYKQIGTFYLIAILCAVIARLTNFETDALIFVLVHRLAESLATGLTIGILINISIRIWVRFRQSLYGDEAYLTHTLPVSRHTLWAAKFLNSIIITLTNILLALLTVGILFYSPELVQSLSLDQPAVIIFGLSLLLTIILQIIFIVQVGFIGILAGHRYHNKRGLHTLIFGLAAYFAGSLIILGLALVWSLLDPSIADILFHNTVEYSGMTKIMFGISILYTMLIVASYFINNHLLSHGVDVE